jgi:hypothetical protein
MAICGKQYRLAVPRQFRRTGALSTIPKREGSNFSHVNGALLGCSIMCARVVVSQPLVMIVSFVVSCRLFLDSQLFSFYQYIETEALYFFPKKHMVGCKKNGIQDFEVIKYQFTKVHFTILLKLMANFIVQRSAPKSVRRTKS